MTNIRNGRRPPYMMPRAMVANSSCLSSDTRVARAQLTDGQATLKPLVDVISAENGLDEHERDVLAGVIEGLDNREIAIQLGVPRSTVKWYLHTLCSKTEAKDREGLLRLAVRLCVDGMQG